MLLANFTRSLPGLRVPKGSNFATCRLQSRDHFTLLSVFGNLLITLWWAPSNYPTNAIWKYFSCKDNPTSIYFNPSVLFEQSEWCYPQHLSYLDSHRHFNEEEIKFIPPIQHTTNSMETFWEQKIVNVCVFLLTLGNLWKLCCFSI